MSKGESNIFTRLKERITRPEDRFERVENGLMSGTPDVNYCFVGTEGWIELKAPKVPVREDTPLFGSGHGLSVEQRNWFIKQQRAKGHAFLFIATRQMLLLLNSDMVTSNDVNKMTLVQLRNIAIWVTPVPVGQQYWIDLRRIFCGVK